MPKPKSYEHAKELAKRRANRDGEVITIVKDGDEYFAKSELDKAFLPKLEEIEEVRPDE
jgi:hypothetical protein